jgi:hypothetical protein
MHKHSNKNTSFTKLNKSIQDTQHYIYSVKKWNKKNMKESDKKIRISSQLHVIYIYSNNGRHPVTKTFTLTIYSSLHLSTLHFFSFKFHSTKTSLPFAYLSCGLPSFINFLPLHYTPHHYTSPHVTSLHV